MRYIALLSVPLVLLIACSNDPPAPTPTATQPLPTRAVQVQPTSTPRVVPTPMPQPTPVPIPGVEAIDATYGEPVPFPENTMLLIEQGCTSCDGPMRALVRVYRNKGEVHFDEIFRAAPVPGEDVYITSFEATPNVSEIVVAVCTKEYCGGVALPRDGAEATFYRSRDAGATWTPIEVSRRYHFVLGLTPQGMVKAYFGRPRAYLIGSSPLQVGDDETWPQVTSGGRVYLRRGNQLLNVDGRVAIEVSQAERINEAFERRGGSPPVVSWYTSESGSFWTTEEGGVQRGLRSPGFVSVGGWLDANTLVISVDDPVLPIGRTPALLDWETGIMQPFADYPEPLRGGRNTVRAVVRGPFLRVAIDGDCVHLREAASIEAAIIGCVAVSALVKDMDGVGGGRGRWVRVRLFDGREGFIAGEYLVD